MVDIGLVASTLITVETTLYAVAVALYVLLLQRARLSPVDRILISLLGRPKQFEEVASRIVDAAFGRTYIAYVTMSYIIALGAGIGSMLQDSLTLSVAGLGIFGAAYVTFMVAIEIQIPRAVRRILGEVEKEKQTS